MLGHDQWGGANPMYQPAPLPKACAISDNGHFGCAWGTSPRDRTMPTDPQQRALILCARYAGKSCFVYVVDDQVVYRSSAR